MSASGTKRPSDIPHVISALKPSRVVARRFAARQCSGQVDARVEERAERGGQLGSSEMRGDTVEYAALPSRRQMLRIPDSNFSPV
jgi:hypothetical protein